MRAGRTADALAHAACDHRRRTAGANGDDNVAAIDDGENEVKMREIVHHVDGGKKPTALARAAIAVPMSPAPRRGTAMTPPRSAAERIAFDPFDAPKHPRRRSRSDHDCHRWQTANPPAGRRQQPQFRRAQDRRLDEQHHAALQIEEHGQKSHAILASPLSGVDWNYFLHYMSHSMPQRRVFFSAASQLCDFS